MWHVEGLIGDYWSHGLYCPTEFPSFPSRKLAIADAESWLSKGHNEARTKFFRVIDDKTGRFYCLDRRDPRYPRGIAHHKWKIATSSGGYIGVDWLTRDEAEEQLKKL